MRSDLSYANACMHPNPDDPLDSALKTSASQPVPEFSSLRREVWRRLAAERKEPAAPRLIERIEAIFRQPAFSAAFVAACLLCGLFVAEVRASRATAKHNQRLVRDYAKWIDPRIASPKEAPATEP